MDGSGSRGITWLLRAGGVWMRTTNEWLDWARDEHPLSNALMQATHSLDYKYAPRNYPFKSMDQMPPLPLCLHHYAIIGDLAQKIRSTL